MIYDGQPFASPGEALKHFGVKGMRWGVRKQRKSTPELSGYIKEPIVRKTKNGDEFTLSPNSPSKLHRGLARISKSYRENYKKSSNLTIKDKDGKKIGSADFWLKGKDDIYLNWITIEKSARGRGYATEILKAAAEHGQTTGRKRLVLEVPGNAPDARHIYENMGFKATRELAPKGSALWDGLTEMEYRFD